MRLLLQLSENSLTYPTLSRAESILRIRNLKGYVTGHCDSGYSSLE